MTTFEERQKYMVGISEEGDPRYKSIRHLHELLILSYISHSFKRLFDGYQISIYQRDKRVFSIIEHFGSYGVKNDKLEMWSYEMECKDFDPIGYLTAEECLGIVKYYCFMSDEELSDHLEES